MARCRPRRGCAICLAGWIVHTSRDGRGMIALANWMRGVGVIIRERFTRGFVAGVIAGAISSLADYISYLLGIGELLYIEWAAVLLYGYRVRTLGETIVAQLGQLFFSGILGVGFAYLLRAVNTENYLFKGVVYGITVWFAVHVIVKLFRVTALIPVGPDTLLSDLVTASLFGLVLAEALLRMEKRVEA